MVKCLECYHFVSWFPKHMRDWLQGLKLESGQEISCLSRYKSNGYFPFFFHINEARNGNAVFFSPNRIWFSIEWCVQCRKCAKKKYGNYCALLLGPNALCISRICKEKEKKMRWPNLCWLYWNEMSLFPLDLTTTQRQKSPALRQNWNRVKRGRRQVTTTATNAN